MKNKIYNRFYYLLFLAVIFWQPIVVNAQVLIKGPYLLEPGKTEMFIRWESEVKKEYFVEYGENEYLDRKESAVLRGEKAGLFLYEVVLKGLQSGATYNYRVADANKKYKIAKFRTYNSEQENCHFVAMGDSRSNPDIFLNIINNVREDEPDLIISMGDLVASGGRFLEWNKYYFDVAKTIIDHIPLVSTLGDHEGGPDDGELFSYFLRKKKSYKKTWFSFDYGNVHFVSLDYRYPESKEMADWFVKDMSSSKAHWKFVFFHRPVYNLGGHRSTWGWDIWPDLFRSQHVDIVFAGHSHVYERFYPMKSGKDNTGWPVTYITTGGAGAGLYDVMKSSILAVAESVNHYVDIRINKDTLNLKAIRNDGSLLDELRIVKNGKKHNSDYDEMAKSQEVVNQITSFIKAASFSLNYLPLREYTATHFLNLKSFVNEDIPLRIELTEKSAHSYNMESYSGVLKNGTKLKIPIDIYSKADSISLSSWGRINPELRLKLTYKYNGKTETIIGGRAEYWPEDVLNYKDSEEWEKTNK
jgi:predicted phosphodiesterase